MNDRIEIGREFAEYLISEALDVLKTEVVAGYLTNLEIRRRDEDPDDPDAAPSRIAADLMVSHRADALRMTLSFQFGSQGYLAIDLDAYPITARWSKGDEEDE